MRLLRPYGNGTLKRFANILLLIVVLAMGFGIMEMVARNLPDAKRLGWNLVVGLDERVARARPEKPGRRVLVLGDSFAEWMEADPSNFARVAEAEMRRRGQDVELVNLGEAGSGIADYYRNLLIHGPHLQPDQVIIALYLGNDLTPFRDGLPPPDKMDWLPPPATKGGWRDTLKRSVLLNMAYRQAKLHIPWFRSGFTAMVLEHSRTQNGKDHVFVERRLAQVDPALLRDAEADAINGWDLATALFTPDYYGDLAAADPATDVGARALAALADLRVLCRQIRSQGAEPRVMLIPPSPWVGSRYHDYFLRLGYGQLGPTEDSPVVVERLKAMLAEDNIPVLDLLPLLRASRQPAYLERDIHFNAHGQDVAGRALADFLDTP